MRALWETKEAIHGELIGADDALADPQEYWNNPVLWDAYLNDLASMIVRYQEFCAAVAQFN